MTDNDVRRVWLMFGIDRNAARIMYAERFGRAHDDPTIDAELTELFAGRDDGDAAVAVPTPLLLALIMRPPPGKGRGKKRVPVETWRKRYAALAVRNAENDWARQVEAEGPNVSKRAKHAAATAAYANIHGHGIKTIEALEKRMNFARGKRAIAKK